jgi:hypothetical protein
MVTRTQSQIVSDLKRHGYVFTQFTLTSEGTYSISDADWNYKDVPHLEHLHKLVDGIIGTVEDKSISSIFLQTILGFKFPVVVYNYQSGSDLQTYFTSLFFFVLVIETFYRKVGPTKTQVNTTYAIGSTKLWRFAFPIVRWLLKRNYHNLMSDDIPMRERRGQLRSWGYSFKGDQGSHSFEKTMHIAESNVIIPAQSLTQSKDKPESTLQEINIEEDLHENEFFHFGRSDHLGFQILKKEQKLLFFPRLCPHEGACLDRKQSDEAKIQCPWHGRIFKPQLVIDLLQDQKTLSHLNFQIAIDGNKLRISER